MIKTLKNPYNDSCKLEQCIYNEALKDFREWLMQKRQEIDICEGCHAFNELLEELNQP